MAAFMNRFSWSASRGKLFKGCPRAYWLRYYGSWKGWERNAHAGRRIAYRIGKMTGMARWRGSIVHDTIEWASGRISKKLPVTLDAMKERARSDMKRGWRQSRDGLWVSDPKRNVNLAEHYYTGDTEDIQDWARNAQRGINDSLDRWWDLGWPEVLERLGIDDWVELEGRSTVQFRGVETYVQPDLAYWRDGVLMVVDWKTGKPREADRVQILIYVVWAIKELGVPMAKIRTQLVYLLEGHEKTSAVTTAELREFAEALWADIELVRASLSHVERNEARARDFPKTTDKDECARCDFRQLCYGAGDAPGPALAKDPPMIEEPESWPSA